MKDIIGIEFFDKKQGFGAVITWGNIFHDDELLHVVKYTLSVRFKALDIEWITLVPFLECIADYPYFYECLIPFIQSDFMVTGNKKYEKRIKAKQILLKNGNEILFLGFKNRYYQALENIKQGIPYHYVEDGL